ncbi:MAG: DUF5615 family PIN-like protein [Candidatus Saccharibacteria bacterium]
MEPRPKFLADEMLGSLARWLRIAGYDTVYAKDLSDSEVLALAKREGRFLLTRDIQLAGRAGRDGLLIKSPVLDEQMEQVIAAFQLTLEEQLTRCTVCNGPLRTVGPEAVADKVPERVREANAEFFVCQDCGQVYWKGSHWRHIEEKLKSFRSDSSPR